MGFKKGRRGIFQDPWHRPLSPSEEFLKFQSTVHLATQSAQCAAAGAPAAAASTRRSQNNTNRSVQDSRRYLQEQRDRLAQTAGASSPDHPFHSPSVSLPSRAVQLSVHTADDASTERGDSPREAEPDLGGEVTESAESAHSLILVSARRANWPPPLSVYFYVASVVLTLYSVLKCLTCSI